MISTNIALAAVLTVTLVNGFFSTNMMKKYKEMYSSQVEHLETENEKLRNRLDEFNEFGIIVDVTMYQPTYYQTDSDPDVTADGTRIRIHKASEYIFVACGIPRLTSNSSNCCNSSLTSFFFILGSCCVDTTIALALYGIPFL